jgi:hypothetical protein
VSEATWPWVKTHPIKAAEHIRVLELENREMRRALRKLGYIAENNQGTVVVFRDPLTLPEDVMP